MALSRRQQRAQQASTPSGGSPIPARYLRFEASEWIGQAEKSCGVRAGGDEVMRARTLRQLARTVWGREALRWALANGFTRRALNDAQRNAREDPGPESR
jgi:hypothetical protein